MESDFSKIYLPFLQKYKEWIHDIYVTIRCPPFAQDAMGIDMEPENYETLVRVEVLGYLIGAGENQEPPAIVTRENAVEFKFGRERAVFGDIPRTIPDGWYRK